MIRKLDDLLKEGGEKVTNKLRPIKFEYYIDEHNQRVQTPTIKPTDYDNIIHLYNRWDVDVMLAWNDDGSKNLYIGKWNDGVKE